MLDTPFDVSPSSLERRLASPKNLTYFPDRSTNAAVFSSSARVAKILYGRDDDDAPIL